ncbi:xaa-Pro aminopeptidase ApepP-like [Gigantopelta aegis]|uniref:xaa-Pro aminopeptidase ApepP-like n=1 Tax=Gigantopelta aegis TaxID=1735272 RepID=UPI001B8882C2|nr:xaa-Pro aminopeptidase ApepP-like [Gigantopelta aegis]
MCWVDGGVFIGVLLALACLVTADPIQEEDRSRVRRDVKSSPSVADRPGCRPGAVAPPNRVITTSRLAALRALFPANGGIHAYIVPSEDAHQSEYVTEYDKRRQYISGFSGSAGFAVVLLDKAALWTDGRYFLQGEAQLDCNWIFMKAGAGAPKMTTWLISELKDIPGAKVGVNPFLMSSRAWTRNSYKLSNEGITLVGTRDLIDVIWTAGRPAPADTPINALELKFSGKRWQDKMVDLRREMTEHNVAAVVVTSLDETAWLFNLRASDIPYNPFFISYAIVEHARIRLYIVSADSKLSRSPTDRETTNRLYEHLNTRTNGTCVGVGGLCVQVIEYDPETVKTDIKALTDARSDVNVWVTPYCSQGIVSAIPKTNAVQRFSSISVAKAMKNKVETQGMFNAHNRDSAVLIKFMAFLEREVKEEKHWTEMSAADKLKEYREAEQYNRGLSFESISASGSNGAIIHYSPEATTNKAISTRDMYLLDSGGQYLDGTTDVTRTFHFGNPTDYEKECYTRVLMGSIDLAQLVWPKGLTRKDIDVLARRPLWDVGLIYRHGTSHGVGAYLSVHEAIAPSSGVLAENMFLSDEPGFYEDGKFGIRLETIVMVENKTTKYSFPSTRFLGYKPVQLVPFERNLINPSMLSKDQTDWLNRYHAEVERTVGPLVAGSAGYEWLKHRTKPF